MSSSANSSRPAQATANDADTETLTWGLLNQRLTELQGQAHGHRYLLNLDTNPCASVGLVTQLKSLADDTAKELSSWCSKSLARVKDLKNASQGEYWSKELTGHLNRKNLEEDPIKSICQLLPLMREDARLTRNGTTQKDKQSLKSIKTNMWSELHHGFRAKACTHSVAQEMFKSTADTLSGQAAGHTSEFRNWDIPPERYRPGFHSAVEAFHTKASLDSKQIRLARSGPDSVAGSTTAQSGTSTETQGTLEAVINDTKTKMDQYRSQLVETPYEKVNTVSDFRAIRIPYTYGV